MASFSLDLMPRGPMFTLGISMSSRLNMDGSKIGGSEGFGLGWEDCCDGIASFLASAIFAFAAAAAAAAALARSRGSTRAGRELEAALD